MRLWLVVAAIIAAIAAVSVPAALADSTNSSNWAGYAVHRHGVSFRSVTGTWRQPRSKCTSRQRDLLGLLGRPRRLQPERSGARADRDRGRLQPQRQGRLERLVRARARSLDADQARRPSGRSDPGDGHGDRQRPRSGSTTSRATAASIRRCSRQASTSPRPSGSSRRRLSASAPARARRCRWRTSRRRGSTPRRCGRRRSRRHDLRPRVGLDADHADPGGRRFAAHGGDRASAAAAHPSSLLSRGSAFAVNYAVVPMAPVPGRRADAASLRAGQLFHCFRCSPPG